MTGSWSFWSLAPGPWSVVTVSLVHGPWSMIPGRWCLVPGHVVPGPWSLVPALWPLAWALALCSLASGPWSLILSRVPWAAGVHAFIYSHPCAWIMQHRPPPMPLTTHLRSRFTPHLTPIWCPQKRALGEDSACHTPANKLFVSRMGGQIPQKHMSTRKKNMRFELTPKNRTPR